MLLKKQLKTHKEIFEALGEADKPIARKQLWAITCLLGKKPALELLQEAKEIETYGREEKALIGAIDFL